MFPLSPWTLISANQFIQKLIICYPDSKCWTQIHDSFHIVLRPVYTFFSCARIIGFAGRCICCNVCSPQKLLRADIFPEQQFAFWKASSFYICNQYSFQICILICNLNQTCPNFETVNDKLSQLQSIVDNFHPTLENLKGEIELWSHTSFVAFSSFLMDQQSTHCPHILVRPDRLLSVKIEWLADEKMLIHY